MTANVFLPQSGGRRSTNLIKETTPGTPTAGAWYTLRNTGGAGVVGDFSTTESAELTGTQSLGLKDLIRTGERGQADYSFEFSAATAGAAPFEFMLESFMQAEFGDSVADRLIPGTKEVTLSVEDIFNDISKVQSIQGAQVSAFSLSMASAEIVTGSMSLVAPIFNVGTPTVIAGTPTFTVTNGNEIEPDSGSVPSSAIVGATILITASTDATDRGYYKITAVAANKVTVDGTLTNGALKAMTVWYSSASIQSTTPTAASSNEPFIAGNSMAVELSFDGGSTWIDSLERGFRFPSAELSGSLEVAELREVTNTEAYGNTPTARAIDLTLNYHLTDTAPIRYLNEDTEIGVRFQMIDGEGSTAATGNKYIFTFPRCKTVSANAGDASRGSEMTGTWTLKALLNSSDIDMQVDRVAAS